MVNKYAVTVLALGLLASGGAFAGSGQAAGDLPAISGILKLEPVTEQSYIAAWLPVPDGMSLAGIRWFNNDQYAPFPEVMELHGSEDGLGSVAACTLVASGVDGISLGWSELTFGLPIACGGDGAFVIFRVPANAAATVDGAGGGAGLGFASGDGARGWVTVDGQNWVGIDSSFGLAVKPVLVAYSSVASKSAAGRTRDGKPALDSVQYETELRSVSPNPFNPDTEIQFTLRETTRVAISVIDVGGRRIASLVDDSLEPGLHSVRWDGRDSIGRGAASGLYFVHMAAGERAFTRRVLLVK
jgi:hypothetical protein